MLEKTDYPLDFDCVWVAVDTNQELAVFVTGGEGAIPSLALQSPIFMDIEELVLALPATNEYEIIRPVPDPESFISFAIRGFYVFDAALCNDGNTRAEPGDYVQMVRPKKSGVDRASLGKLSAELVDFGQWGFRFGDCDQFTLPNWMELTAPPNR